MTLFIRTTDMNWVHQTHLEFYGTTIY